MSVSPNALRQLHRIHQQLRDLRDRQTRGPQQILARQSNVSRLEQQVLRLKDELRNAELQAKAKESELKANEAKIVNLGLKLNQCATNKEYKALQDQIAADKMACSVLADEILEAIEKVELMRPSVPTAESELAKAREDLEQLTKTVNERVDLIKNDIARLESELNSMELALPDDMREAYTRVVKSKVDDAMAPVENQTCTGCDMRVTANMENDLALGKVVFCKSCGRLLYAPETPSFGGR